MGQLDNWKMTPLDTLLCNNQLQILKTLIFFFPPARQRQMIFLVKLMELRQCLSLPLSALTSLPHPPLRAEQGPEMFDYIFPYCDREKQQTFKQLQNALRMMNTVQQFSDSGMFDNLGEMMGSMGGFGSFRATSESGATGDFSDTGESGATGGFSDTGESGGFTAMNAFAQMAAMAGAGMNRSGPANSSDGSMSSMLSSMMNPEQQALFKEYEAMLDDM